MSRIVEVNVHEAKTHLSRLLSRVEAGEIVVIARAGQPVARLVAEKPAPGKRILGRDRGKGWVAAEFDAPLPEELLKYFR